MNSKSNLDQFWESEPQTIRAFLAVTDLYEKLGEEISYTLEKQIVEAGIEYSSVSHRAKTLRSFCEKVVRKKYDAPLEEITDLSGVRIIYLYEQDLEKIENVIRENFEVIEHVNKTIDAEPHEFGYGAVHFLVKLGKSFKGARYDDLKELVCEIQVRTILQDSWAIVAHHLSYKRESDIPNALRRKLNALSGLFETADDQFNQLNTERIKYRSDLAKSLDTDSGNILIQAINLDSLMTYAGWKFPDRKKMVPDSASVILNELNEIGYNSIQALDDDVNRALDAVYAHEEKYPPYDPATGEDCLYAQGGVIRSALAFVNEAYLELRNASDDYREKKDEFRSLVK